MSSIEGITIPDSKEMRLLPIVRPFACSLGAQTFTPPVGTMPVEVISNIICLASHSSDEPISQSLSSSHVCRRWRQISLSTSSLWNFVLLSFPLSKMQLSRTIAWIIRSRNHPLDIHMDFRDPSWDWDEAFHVFSGKTMDSIMRILVPQAPRWRSIELLADTWAPIFTFLSSTAAISTPLLQTIRLARCNEYFVAHGEKFIPANLATPVAWFRGGAGLRHLRQVTLSGVHIDWAQTGLTGLRELELRYHARDVMPTLSDFRQILRANATLERLVILGWGPQMTARPVDDELQTIDLPRLEVLEIGFVDVGYAINLLSLFTLPNLRVLAVEDVVVGIHLWEPPQDCSRLLDCLVEMASGRGTGTPEAQAPLSRLCELSLRSIRADDPAAIRGLFGQLRGLMALCLDHVSAGTVLGVCSALCAATCDRLERLTLKDVDPAVAGHALTSLAFPPRLRVFLDMEELDLAEEEEGQDEDDPVVATCA